MPEPDYTDAYDGKADVSYYRHAKPHFAAPDYRGVSGLKLPTRPIVETPANFWGRGMLRTPGDGVVAPEDVDARVHNPRPLDGVWRAEEQVPVMRGMPVMSRYH